MPLRIPIGIDDFRTLREGGLEYVDKTSLIQELLDRSGVQVVLLPRPRRFGKTLNLSMLRCWFEKRDEDVSHLFQDLAIWQAGAETRAHFQRYPVIHFNFKGSKASTFEACWAVIREKIIDVFIEHRYLLESGRLDEIQAQRFRQILDGTADRGLYERALLDMSAHLHAHHGEKVVILIDEYDEPIHAGYFHGFAQTIIDFMRNFLGAALKSNSHLYKAVITGILRVAKENLFSGLNNPGVYTLLRPELHTCFGFTEAEVAALLERCGRANKLKDVRTWYNGYLFDALLGGDAEVFEQELQAFVTNLLSYHDPGRLRRPDVTVRPMSPGKPGVVLELKVARQGKRTLEEALAEGLSQIATRDYGAELRAAGAAPIHAMAVAFDGKEVRVRAAPDETRTKS